MVGVSLLIVKVLFGLVYMVVGSIVFGVFDCVVEMLILLIGFFDGLVIVFVMEFLRISWVLIAEVLVLLMMVIGLVFD